MNHNLEVVLMTRVPVIVADVLVLILTWVKTYSQVMNARKAGQTMSVSLCLLRDGQWIIFPVSMDCFILYLGTAYFAYAAPLTIT